MQNVCQITFCQQIGKNKKHNQDALFNGETVFQFKLKTAEKRVENRPHFIIGIADGISNSNHAEKASKCVMSAERNEILRKPLNRRIVCWCWIRRHYGVLI